MAIKGAHSARTVVAALAAAAALVLTGVACGGGGAKTTGTSPTVQWADSVCSAVSAWKADLQKIVTTVKGEQLSKSVLSDAADEARKATETLTTTLQETGKPDTAAGAQAKEILDQLATQLRTSLQAVQKAAASGSGTAAAVSTAATEFATMQEAVSRATSELQQLDPQGELAQAFQDAPSCAALRAS